MYRLVLKMINMVT
ncbi:hypothetical protein F383_26669 [Gossypium arboreum]|uniref:Uncharacterized protein n=1 Tax=Gossypium arboreum TaxID=29729 RepID=A0A0B0PEL5_GOSAR|nr:hypothetical protein F383_26669 [Gossypium arboreum]